MALLNTLARVDFAKTGDMKHKLFVIPSFTGVNEIYPGWVFCNGATLLRTDVLASGKALAPLYDYLGANYGTAGKLPDATSGRTPITKDGTFFTTIGQLLGESTHVLTNAEQPSHNHNIYFWFYTGANSAGDEAASVCYQQYSYHGGFVNWSGTAANGQNFESPYDGYNVAHENMHPHQVVSGMVIRV